MIEIQFKNTSRTCKTKGNITIRQDGDIRKMDSFDIAIAEKRDKFIKKLIEECPGLKDKQAEIEKAILQKADEALNDDNDVDDEDDAQILEPIYLSKLELEKTDGQLIEYAEKMLKSPYLIDDIINHAHSIGIAGEDNLIVGVYLLGTSRLLSKPLAGIIMGQSSAGKSYVIKKVSTMFPEEVILRAHKITPTALQYMQPGSLKHRFVVAGERSRKQDDDAAEATRALREMISEGHLSTLVSCKNKNGRYEAVEVKQEGPIAYIESTTLGITQLFNEDRTRFLLMCSNESQQQTEEIISDLAASVSKPRNPDERDSILALHHTAQRLLKPQNIIIPFASDLQESFKTGPVETRRTFGQLLSLIQAVTLLYQYQRDNNEFGLIATIDDYNIVKRFLVEPLARSMGRELTPGARELLEYIPNDDFAVKDLIGKVSGSENTIRSRVRELSGAGQIEIVEYGKGRQSYKYRLVDDPPELCGLTLPELEKNYTYAPAGVADKT